jgi:hypothetical protein
MSSISGAAPAAQTRALPAEQDDDLIAQLAAEDVQTDAALREILVERNAEAARLAALARSMEERDHEIVALLHQKEKLDRAQVLLRHQFPQSAPPAVLHDRARPANGVRVSNGTSRGPREQDHDLLTQLAAEEAKINTTVRRILAERDTEATRLATLARAREERDREIIALLREKKKQDQEIQAFVDGLPQARRPAVAVAAARPPAHRNGTNGNSVRKSGAAPAGEPAGGLPEPALEGAGLALWRVAEHLRDVRERWPTTGDLARRLQAMECLARELAGEVTETLRRGSGGQTTGPGPEPSSPDLHALVRTWSTARRASSPGVAPPDPQRADDSSRG